MHGPTICPRIPFVSSFVPVPSPQVLREHGVRVLTVREILAYNVDTNMSARVDLEVGLSVLHVH